MLANVPRCEIGDAGFRRVFPPGVMGTMSADLRHNAFTSTRIPAIDFRGTTRKIMVVFMLLGFVTSHGPTKAPSASVAPYYRYGEMQRIYEEGFYGDWDLGLHVWRSTTKRRFTAYPQTLSAVPEPTRRPIVTTGPVALEKRKVAVLALVLSGSVFIVRAGLWLLSLPVAFELTVLVLFCLLLLVCRWLYRRDYAHEIGFLFGDSDVAAHIFPRLCGSEGPWRYRYIGKGDYHVTGPGVSYVTPGTPVCSVRRWWFVFVQDVYSFAGDSECPFVCRVRYSWPRLSWFDVAVPAGVCESDDAACLFHPGRGSSDELEIAWLGSSESTKLPAAAYRAASARYRLATTKAYGIVAVALQSATRDENVIAMAMSLIKTGIDYGTDLPPDLNNMPLYSGMCPEDAKPMGIKPVCNVVYPVEGFGMGAPMISKETERDTINRRIAQPRSDYIGDSKMRAYAREFINYLVAGTKLTPWDHDAVVRQMNRPSQKSNRIGVDTVMDFLPDRLKQLFTKREAVAVGKPARNICTVSPQRLYRAARFTLAASQHMKRFKWWVWGVGAGDTARKYQKACSGADKMMESDFSKFDASLGPFWQWFNMDLMRRLFDKSHWDELNNLLEDATWQSVVTTLGQMFGYGCGRMSGVNETALFNTADQAFVQYVSFREHGMTHDRVIRLLEDECLFGGDDGVVPFYGQDLAATAAIFGMKITFRVFNALDPCRFLGRIYLCGKTSADSVQDISDWLANIHLVSCAGNTTVAQALVNTATGLWVTDSKTPLIREYCKSVFRAYPHLSRTIHRNDEWWFKEYDITDPFPLDDYSDETAIMSHFASVMGVAVEGLYALEKWFMENKFYVGSRLPNLEIEFRPSLKTSFQIYGMPFGPPADPPALPRITRKMVAEIRESVAGVLGTPGLEESVDDVLQDPLTIDDKQQILHLSGVESAEDANPAGALKPLWGPKDCYRCGITGHIAAACPLKLVCKLCKVQGHTAKSCTAREEREASEILDCLGLGPDIAPIHPREKG